MLFYLALGLIGISGDMPTPEVERCFQEGKFVHLAGTSAEETYHYRLLVPQLAQNAKAPLIVLLHGYGEIEFEYLNRGQLKHTQRLFATSQDCEAAEFFFLAMQCPSPPGQWYRQYGPPQPDEPMTALKALIDDLITKYPLDVDRISLLGISGGGTSTWEMITRYPDMFAAAAPLASGGGDLSRLEAAVNVPVWAFQSSGDHADRVRESVRLLRERGCNAYLTEVEQTQHDCWTVTFLQYDILQWLISQRRGSWSWWPPGYSNPWQLAVQAGVPTLIVLACIQELRRRRKRYEQ